MQISSSNSCCSLSPGSSPAYMFVYLLMMACKEADSAPVRSFSSTSTVHYSSHMTLRTGERRHWQSGSQCHSTGQCAESVTGADDQMTEELTVPWHCIGSGSSSINAVPVSWHWPTFLLLLGQSSFSSVCCRYLLNVLRL